MDDLDYILQEYAAFETEVRVFSSALWYPWCSNCEKICCKAVYCRETFESPFLFSLIKKQSRQVSNRAQKGWLGEAGCILGVGRPSVCYEFLCDNILKAQKTDVQRYAMLVLAKLISHIGKRALGSRHLIEIMDPVNLKRVRYSRFENRLSEARKALEVVQLILGGASPGDDALKVLSKISNGDPVKGR